ncbi:lecithin retinol acyltransferase family protein [Cyanobium sp. CH-040]|uniref:lecithin retinol acyltransferase family protein n=1 Tax=Cyanobium sp. CH-040 TaxID=2823708 RepID=UPI0020CF1803|nr:lecithin retinol acyltransferase family protein [Cyanobium sp. CH-040]MCP9927156.1 lecithin retinol acyltransferase family protein [Cyanobium sp. CH-040]
MAAADHLQVPRQHGLFNHHGIDLGDGTVAHYLEGREILRSSQDDFSRHEPVSVVVYPKGGCSPTGVTLRRAMGRLGEQNYNLLFNNCEHFAHWCKTGRHRSGQVEGWLHTGSLGALALGQWLPAAVLAGARALLRQGVPLDEGLELVRRSLRQLEQLHRTLQARLDEQLARAESRWGQGQFESLRRAAQRLADQLAEVEDLEDALESRLQRLLEGQNTPHGLLEPGGGGGPDEAAAGLPGPSGPPMEP